MIKEVLKKNRINLLIEKVFEPDSDGVSDWIEVEKLPEHGLKWSKNGNTRRGAPGEDKTYRWEFQRVNASPTSEILQLRPVGFSNRQPVNDSIRKDLFEEIRNKQYCNFSLLPVPEVDKEVDHRFGYKEHSKYTQINIPSEQKLEHFQLLHHSQNIQKREMCKKCIETSQRPRHPELDFVEGTSKLDNDLVCNGCYLAEPERYR